jgi:Colicin V production protein
MAPHFLAAGTHSRYSALVGLACAVGGVVVFQLIARVLAHTIRGGLRLLPPLRLLDSLGGLAVGAAWGLVLVWVVGAVALQIPGHKKVHREVRQSKVLAQLDQYVPPHDVLKVQKQIASITAEIERRGGG